MVALEDDCNQGKDGPSSGSLPTRGAGQRGNPLWLSPSGHKGGRSKGKPFVAVAVLGTQGAGQRGNPLWLSPCPRDPDVLDLGVEITIGVAWRDMLSEGQSCTLGPHIMSVRIDFGRTK
jgi:hypothetical protein